MKSEPYVYSIDDLARDGRTGWNGVRNYMARNFMREMAAGDRVFFYHSSVDPAGVAGIMEVARAAYPDPTQFDKKGEYFEPRATVEKPVWFHVDVRFIEKLPRLVTMDELKRDAALRRMMLFTHSRLSVQPVLREHWDRILSLSRPWLLS
ncbi:MAG: EVE domain-containing protein [Elusimicrobia bacterium]|nr:EVE domain-containing protein [Elusimicrobiota bacterium]